MKTGFGIALCVCLVFAVSACSASLTPTLPPVGPAAPAATSIPTANGQTLATATPINLTRSDPMQLKMPPTNPCTILTQKDMSDLFGAEVNQPISSPPSPVNQVIFLDTKVSANESYCVYMAFHRSGSQSGAFYQITYWLDAPNQATSADWAQVWIEGESKAAQTISGVAEGAFYNDGRLTFKKGSTYVTVEALGSKFDTKTADGVNQQIEIEKQVALKALNHMEN